MFIGESFKIKESECRWRCVLPLKSRWHNKHSWNVWRGKRLELSNKSRIKVHVVLRFFRSLMSSSARTARQNKFVLINSRTIQALWYLIMNRSRQNKLCHFLRECIFSACATHAAKQYGAWTSPGYKSNILNFFFLLVFVRNRRNEVYQR